MARILGIDPGLNITGYGVVETAAGGGLRLCEAGVIRGGTGNGSDDEGGERLAARLVPLFEGLTEVIEQYKPEVMAIEQLYSHYKRPTTAILMGHARGVLCLAAARAGIPVRSYAATQIKKILTGNGRAPKSQMQTAVQREMNLPTTPEPPDVADALAVAICHHYLSRHEAMG